MIIFLIDQDPVFKHTLKETLALDGHDVHLIDSTSDIQQFQVQPHLIMIDLHHNLFDIGWESVVDHIKTLWPDKALVFIGLDGSGDTTLLDRGIQKGIKQFIYKPDCKESVVKKVNSIIPASD